MIGIGLAVRRHVGTALGRIPAHRMAVRRRPSAGHARRMTAGRMRATSATPPSLDIRCKSNDQQADQCQRTHYALPGYSRADTNTPSIDVNCEIGYERGSARTV